MTSEWSKSQRDIWKFAKSSIISSQVVGRSISVKYGTDLITWHPTYYKRSRLSVEGYGHSVKTSSDRQIIALF